MPGPFPGMDPYLEAPHYWQEFHDRLVFHLGSVLQEVLPENYVAAFGQRVEVVLGGRHIVPDVAVTQRPQPGGRVAVQVSPTPDQATLIVVQPEETLERFVEVLHVPDRTLVTVIELASPTNKADPRGRKAYHGKQEAVLGSSSHLVEVDLLRAGPHWAAVPEALTQECRPYDYLVCVNRASRRDAFECYFRRLRESLPAVAVPLLPEDADATLDIQKAFNRAYDQGRYANWVNYHDPPHPPLRVDEEWAQALLRDAGVIGPGTSGVTGAAGGE